MGTNGFNQARVAARPSALFGSNEAKENSIKHEWPQDRRILGHVTNGELQRLGDISSFLLLSPQLFAWTAGIVSPLANMSV